MMCYRLDTSHGEGGTLMQKAIIALGLAGLLFAAGSSTASAAFTVPPADPPACRDPRRRCRRLFAPHG
jgi:hypothetical protein